VAFDRKFKMYYEDANHFRLLQETLHNRCTLCSASFKTMILLKKHVKEQHQKAFCEVCLMGLRQFPHERKLYSAEELEFHLNNEKTKMGRIVHPICEFCKDHLFDENELFQHLQKTHYTCHVCDKAGVTFQYFKDYYNLKQHFNKEHFLCQHEECASAFQVFATPLELKMHQTSVHESYNNKHIKIQFNQTSSVRHQQQNNSNNHNNNNVSNTPTTTTSTRQSNQTANPQTININEFPSLTPSSSTNTLPFTSRWLSKQNLTSQNSPQDFPSLPSKSRSRGVKR